MIIISLACEKLTDKHKPVAFPAFFSQYRVCVMNYFDRLCNNEMKNNFIAAPACCCGCGWFFFCIFIFAATKLEFQLNGSWTGKIALKSQRHDSIKPEGKINCGGKSTTMLATIADKVMHACMNDIWQIIPLYVT